MNFIEGTLFKSKVALKAFTDLYCTQFITIPTGSILTYIVLNKRRKSGSAFVFLYDNQIVRIKYNSFPKGVIRYNPDTQNHYGFAFEEVKIEPETI